MSSAVLAGMRLKLCWLWFTSASYAQTFSLFYKQWRILPDAWCLKVFASFSVIFFPKKLLFITKLSHSGFTDQVKNWHRPAETTVRGAERLDCGLQGDSGVFSSLQTIIIWHYFTGWPVSFSRRKRLKSFSVFRAITCQHSCWMDKAAHLHAAWLILAEPLSQLL